MNPVKRLLALIHWLENTLLVVLLMTMIGLAVLQIVLRNGFETGLPWLAPLLRVLVLWIAMLGAVVASRDRRHISSDLLGRFLPSRLQQLSGVLTSVLTAGISLMVSWYSFQFVRMEYDSPSMAFAHVPTWICEGIIPVAFLLVAVRYLLHGWEGLLGRHAGLSEKVT